MKKLLLVLILLATAGSVFAADLKVTGDMMMRGNMDSYTSEAADETFSRSYFDYDLNVNAAFVANENATVFTKLTYDKNVIGNGKVADSDTDSVLSVERAYLNYKFAPFAQLNTGLMGGGQWASAFGDNEINVTRVQFIGALSADMVFIATYEKQDEQGTLEIKDAEKDDTTAYYLASKMKFGPITVMPLLTYATKGISGETIVAALDAEGTFDMYDSVYDTVLYSRLAAGDAPAVAAATADTVASNVQTQADTARAGYLAIDAYTLTTKAFTLGLDGDFGMVGFKSEFVYKKVDTDGFLDDSAAAVTVATSKGIADSTTSGAYVDVFVNVAPAKVGVAMAYGSSDAEDGSYAWGADFDFTQVVDDLYWGADAGLAGFTAYKVYADVAVDKISAGAAFAYGAATDKEVIGDLSFWEVDLSAGYAFDANASYAINFGYASMDNADVEMTDTAWNLTHKFTVKF